MPSSNDPARNIYFRRATANGTRRPATLTLARGLGEMAERALRGGGVHAARGPGSAAQAGADAGRPALSAAGGASRRDDPARGAGITAAGRSASAFAGAGRRHGGQVPTPAFSFAHADRRDARACSIFTSGILLAGARQERSADGRTLRYLDKCENHFLLATAYAALAELLAPTRAGTQTWCRRFGRCLAAGTGAAGTERDRMNTDKFNGMKDADFKGKHEITKT